MVSVETPRERNKLTGRLCSLSGRGVSELRRASLTPLYMDSSWGSGRFGSSRLIEPCGECFLEVPAESDSSSSSTSARSVSVLSPSGCDSDPVKAGRPPALLPAGNGLRLVGGERTLSAEGRTTPPVSSKDCRLVAMLSRRMCRERRFSLLSD